MELGSKCLEFPDPEAHEAGLPPVVMLRMGTVLGWCWRHHLADCLRLALPVTTNPLWLKMPVWPPFSARSSCPNPPLTGQCNPESQ